MKNKGMRQHRFKSNPVEQKFAEVWEEFNTSKIDGSLDGGGYLDYLLAEKINDPNGEVSDRDRVVAATVIQWLGSLVGQRFIMDVMGPNLNSTT